jgi:hypothetical protein
LVEIELASVRVRGGEEHAGPIAHDA